MARRKPQRAHLQPHPDLQQACEIKNIPRVRELFAVESLGNEYATNYSCGVESLDLMGCLLEHGADVETYMCQRSPISLGMVKLFVEFGYDVKAEGHKILQ